jgi:hypothetical protein
MENETFGLRCSYINNQTTEDENRLNTLKSCSILNTPPTVDDVV